MKNRLAYPCAVEVRQEGAKGMADQERPLPKPPKKAFGFQKNEPEQGGQELMADRMAAAAAAGRLDEFLQKEMPGSGHAQALAKMMMGMTGMIPPGSPTAPREEDFGENDTERHALSMPIEDVVKAVHDGDIKGVMDLLRQEHQRRSPDAGAVPTEAGVEQPVVRSEGHPQPMIDKELIDNLLRIAADNNVTLDWLLLRAIKVYVEEYQKTGKL